MVTDQAPSQEASGVQSPVEEEEEESRVRGSGGVGSVLTLPAPLSGPGQSLPFSRSPPPLNWEQVCLDNPYRPSTPLCCLKHLLSTCCIHLLNTY